ncbi:MAG: site-specific integrase [Anaeroplasmataceae bacterium]|nr:site-specific integrase [Anaeroplasmataceae bacterium]
MNEKQILNTLASLISNAGSNNGISIDFAFQNFYNYSKLNCRTATLNFYIKEYKTLSKALGYLNISSTSEVTKVTYKQIESFLKASGYSNSTINKCTDLLKMIFKTNNILEYINHNPIIGMKKLKEEDPEIKIVSKPNIQKILDYIKSLPHNFTNIRKITALLLLKDTGVRLNELLHIEIKNISIDNNTIFLKYTKTHNTRYVFFTDDTKKFLIEYISLLDNESDNIYLFRSKNKNTYMSTDVVYHFIDKIYDACEIEQSISPHKWRHTFITTLIEKNVNLSNVMKVAGHTEYSTTKKYIHQSISNLRDSILKA